MSSFLARRRCRERVAKGAFLAYFHYLQRKNSKRTTNNLKQVLGKFLLDLYSETFFEKNKLFSNEELSPDFFSKSSTSPCSVSKSKQETISNSHKTLHKRFIHFGVS
jgi:hypothetical protein